MDAKTHWIRSQISKGIFGYLRRWLVLIGPDA